MPVSLHIVCILLRVRRDLRNNQVTGINPLFDCGRIPFQCNIYRFLVGLLVFYCNCIFSDMKTLAVFASVSIFILISRACIFLSEISLK